MKPGVKTTEFWLTLGSQVIPVLVLLGVLTEDEGNTANTAWAEIVKSAFALLGAAIPVAVYIWSRAKVKAGN